MAKKGMKLTNGDLVIMSNALNKVPDQLTFKDPKKRPILFNIAVSRNKRDLKGRLQDLEATRKNPEKWDEYRKKDVEISKKFAVLDEDGRAKIETIPIRPGQNMEKYIIQGEDDQDSEYNAELSLIKKEFGFDEMEKEIEKKQKDYLEALKTETDFAPQMVDQRDVPDNLPTLAWDGVIFMINPDTKP